eukprot:1160595-Pelagomonas_calceolata.AAC.1
MVQGAMTIVFMLCFVLQFSASTVKDALQCFKKGNRRYSLMCESASKNAWVHKNKVHGMPSVLKASLDLERQGYEEPNATN